MTQARTRNGRFASMHDIPELGSARPALTPAAPRFYSLTMHFSERPSDLALRFRGELSRAGNGVVIAPDAFKAVAVSFANEHGAAGIEAVRFIAGKMGLRLAAPEKVAA